jgi:4-hydroxyphenylpyruvate dioxygenase-like putative hemolysin
LQKILDEWSKVGVRFLTEDENHKPTILIDKENGSTVLQCFTYPIDKTLFFELKQVIKTKKNLKNIQEFRDANVKGLWESLDRALKEGWLFKVNIFGEKK